MMIQERLDVEEERKKLLDKIRRWTFDYENQTKRGNDLFEENLELRAKVVGLQPGSEQRGVLEQLSDLEMTKKALTNLVNDKEKLLEAALIKTAEADEAVTAANLRADRFMEELTTLRGEHDALKVSSDDAGNSNDLLKYQKTQLENELKAYREEAAQRLVDGQSEDEKRLEGNWKAAIDALDEMSARSAAFSGLHADEKRLRREDRSKANEALDDALAEADAKHALALEEDRRQQANIRRDAEAAAFAAATAKARETATNQLADAGADTDAAISKLRTEIAGRDKTVERLKDELASREAAHFELEKLYDEVSRRDDDDATTRAAETAGADASSSETKSRRASEAASSRRLQSSISAASAVAKLAAKAKAPPLERRAKLDFRLHDLKETEPERARDVASFKIAASFRGAASIARRRASGNIADGGAVLSTELLRAAMRHARVAVQGAPPSPMIRPTAAPIVETFVVDPAWAEKAEHLENENAELLDRVDDLETRLAKAKFDVDRLTLQAEAESDDEVAHWGWRPGDVVEAEADEYGNAAVGACRSRAAAAAPRARRAARRRRSTFRRRIRARRAPRPDPRPLRGGGPPS